MAARNNTRWTSAAARRLRGLAGNLQSVESAVCVVVDDLLRGISCPPTDLDAIFPRLNVTGHEPNDEVFGSGALLRDRHGFKIVYSSDLSHGRKRWTIAHELGHALFERTGRNPPRSGREVERLCDMIATELLMPRACFGPRIRESVCLDGVLRLARLFQTSVTASAIRCAELCGVSVFETEDGKFRWGFGAVRRGYTISSEEPLSQAVSSALDADHGSKEIYLTLGGRSRVWLVEWSRIGQGNRTLFMLRPTNATTAREA